ncbi:MAG: hypothetical protein NC187_10100 [Candidatus Amulumruptor caecigallinarius]|nr:hypothetical protein [Candidatus Amulumruptor caecigallinarius]MCM1397818.1 hypothetical protein [Candidatus Amulumruptor caecigallinarius]MCM1454878.1 hypothetical protein [bacterium]
MKFNKIFIPAVMALVAGATVTSCTDDDEYYTPGDPTSSAPALEDFNLSKSFARELVDENDESKGYKYTPEITSPTFTPTLRRSEAANAINVQLGGYVLSGKDTIPYDPADNVWQFPSAVTMQAGQTELQIPVTFLARDVASYKLILRVENPGVLNLAAKTEWVMTATISEGINWVLLDKGTYKDEFFYDGGEYPFPDCEIYYDASQEYGKGKPAHYGHYIIANPYQNDVFNNAAFNYDDPTTYIEFWVIGPGETLLSTDLEVPAGQYYLSIQAHNTGVMNTSYGEDIYAMYPYNFTSYSTDIANYKGQTVLVWKDGVKPDEDMMEAGGVFDPFSEENIENDVYPVGKPGAFALGTFYYLLNAGGGWNYLKDTKAIQFIFPGVTVGDYGINLSYSGHIISEDKQTEWIEAAVEFTGKETSFAYVGLVATTDANYALEVLENSIVAAESEDTGIEPDPSLPVVKVEKLMKPEEDNGIELARFEALGSGNYMLAAISYSTEESTNNKGQVIYTYTPQESATYLVKFTSINDLGGDPNWKSLGVGEYHDDILPLLYPVDPDYLTYEVEVQKHVSEPDMYRIVTPYSKGIYPYTLTDLTPVDEYMVFDASNPLAVKIPPYLLGNIEDLGSFTVFSRSYYAEHYLEMTDDEIIAAGYGGTLDLGIITFPVKGILAQIPDGIYYTNPNGLTELIIPDDGSMTVNRARKAVNKQKSSAPVRHKAVSKAAKAKRNALKPSSVKSVPFVGKLGFNSKRGINSNLPLQRQNAPLNWQVPMKL